MWDINVLLPFPSFSRDVIEQRLRSGEQALSADRLRRRGCFETASLAREHPRQAELPANLDAVSQISEREHERQGARLNAGVREVEGVVHRSITAITSSFLADVADVLEELAE
ncbi:unnamed protein product [Prunus armeniaca]|uniref:Uncharacterized protein n=1 Tax=Prunus armeniaca TaxID=36596 RepID=A0A6J5WL13_PRUAR|nr:unnamed protein product [Prunus armeniaca]